MPRRHAKRERARLIEARAESDRADFRADVSFAQEELEALLAHLSRLEPAGESFDHTRWSWS